MESDRETLSKIVSERADKIQSEGLEQIKRIHEDSKQALSRIVPDLMKQIENFSKFKLLDVLEILRNGGIVKTGEYESCYDHTQWRFSMGDIDFFHEANHRLGKGRFRVTLIMEKLPEEAEEDQE